MSRNPRLKRKFPRGRARTRWRETETRSLGGRKTRDDSRLDREIDRTTNRRVCRIICSWTVTLTQDTVLGYRERYRGSGERSSWIAIIVQFSCLEIRGEAKNSNKNGAVDKSARIYDKIVPNLKITQQYRTSLTIDGELNLWGRNFAFKVFVCPCNDFRSIPNNVYSATWKKSERLVLDRRNRSD